MPKIPHLRPARAADAPAVLALYRSVIGEADLWGGRYDLMELCLN